MGLPVRVMVMSEMERREVRLTTRPRADRAAVGSGAILALECWGYCRNDNCLPWSQWALAMGGDTWVSGGDADGRVESFANVNWNSAATPVGPPITGDGFHSEGGGSSSHDHSAPVSLIVLCLM